MSNYKDVVDRYRQRRDNRTAIAKWHRRRDERIANRDGGAGSGNFGHAGRKGQVGGSAKEGQNESVVWSGYRSKRNAIRDEILKSNKGDGTYDIETKEPVSFEKGYQVAFQTVGSEDSNTKYYISDEEYDKIANQISKETGSKPYLGVFEDAEVSFHCSTLKQALEIGKKYNQKSVWDWRNMREAKVPGWKPQEGNNVKGNE